MEVFDECWRVLRDDGVLFLNLGDSYNGSGGAGGDYNTGGLKEGQPKYPGRNEANLKPKDLMGVPWRTAFALQDRGWYLRSDIIWHKPNPMPESVTDRPTKSHEYIFLLTKNKRYYYDANAIREAQDPASLQRLRRGWDGDGNRGYPNGPQNHLKEYMGKTDEEIAALPGRNKRSVWTIPTRSYKGAHFATFPPALPEICIKAGTSEKGQCPECGKPWERVVEKTGYHFSDKDKENIQIQNNVRIGKYKSGSDYARFKTENPDKFMGWQPICTHDHEPVPQIVLDIFGGSGTTAMVARNLGRIGISIDLSWKYLQLARERLNHKQLDEWEDGREVEENWANTPLFSIIGDINE